MLVEPANELAILPLTDSLLAICVDFISDTVLLIIFPRADILLTLGKELCAQTITHIVHKGANVPLAITVVHIIVQISVLHALEPEAFVDLAACMLEDTKTAELS